jgi:hypothetical protein
MLNVKHEEIAMASVEGEVEFTPSGPKRFKVVFRMGGEVLASEPVDTQKAGEDLIRKTLAEMQAVARREGFL